MERTEGVKVKDDEGLLKKSIKRLDQKKKSSKRKWDARVEGEENRKKMQQQKRSGNIKKRKHKNCRRFGGTLECFWPHSELCNLSF